MSLFGQTLAKISIRPDTKGQRLKSKDPSGLVELMVGLKAPIKEIESWFLELPNEAERCSFNEDHTLASTESVGGSPTWWVTYDSYEKIRVGVHILLSPHELSLSKGKHKFSLVIFKWRIES